jgi:hypothetical protein
MCPNVKACLHQFSTYASDCVVMLEASVERPKHLEVW